MTEPVPVKRRLAAILAADAVGYSRMMGADEEGTLRLLAQQRAIIDGIIAVHHGRIINTAGDSVLAEFESAVEAVRCSVEIQDALKTSNDPLPENQRMLFRIGVNLGDVMVSKDNLHGDGVNVAARLESAADPGGVSISSSVYDQITGKLNLSFVDVGRSQLKNIERPIHIYKLAGTAPARAPEAPRPPRLRLQPAWITAGLVLAAVLAYLAWPARPVAPDPAVQAELAQARADAAAAKRQLEQQRAAETQARSESVLAQARADAEAIRRKAEADAVATRARDTAANKPAPVVPAPAAVVAAPPLAAAPAAVTAPTAAGAASTYDGPWTVTRQCEVFDNLQASLQSWPITVTEGEFIVERGSPGQPGYNSARGRPLPDGRLVLSGHGIAAAASYRGKDYTLQFDGRIENGAFLLKGLYGQRPCTMRIARR